VFTVNLGELRQYVPKDLLPKGLGGNQSAVHGAWLQLCKQVASGMQPDMDSYFVVPKTPPGNMSRGSVSTTYSSDDPHISDLDSESSKDTVHEKHNHEDREKEKDHHKGGKGEEDLKKRKSGSTSGRRNSESRKRTSELAAFDESPGESSPTDDLPRKKRPLSSGSNILDDSIHMPESTGLTIEQLIDHVQTVKKKGLLNEYAHIRMEPQAGTFNHSRLAQHGFCLFLLL
jgi:hypothetical protein